MARGAGGNSGNGPSRGFGEGGNRGFGGRTGGGNTNQRGSTQTNRNTSNSYNYPPSYRSSRPPVYMGGPMYYGPSRRRRRSAGGGFGCLFMPIIVIVILATIMLFVFSSTPANNTGNNSSGSSTSVTKSTIKREPLPKGAVNETVYYTDDLGWVQNPNKLTPGMKNFYQKTGVQPYLYLTDNIAGSHTPTNQQVQDFSNSLYDSLFTDEAHLLLIFMEYQGRYQTWYTTGTQAKSVLDTEAMNILLDYIDKYYQETDLTDEEVFSKAFDDAAKKIMTVEKSPWIPVIIVLSILAILAVVFLFWKQVKKQKNLEAEQTRKILETPLESYQDSKVDELEKKYQNSDPGSK